MIVLEMGLNGSCQGVGDGEGGEYGYKKTSKGILVVMEMLYIIVSMSVS